MSQSDIPPGPGGADAEAGTAAGGHAGPTPGDPWGVGAPGSAPPPPSGTGLPPFPGTLPPSGASTPPQGYAPPPGSMSPAPGQVPPSPFGAPPAYVPPFPGQVPPPDAPAAYVPASSGQVPPPPPGAPPAYTTPSQFQPRRSDSTWVAGLILIAVGALALLGRYVPDTGQYIVLAIGLVLLVLFAVNREYGALVPGCILTGIGAGIPLAAAYPGEVGGALVLVSLACGFMAIWLLSFVFRLPDHHWWPLVPGLILGTIGAGMVAGQRDQAIADAINIGWPVVLVAAGVVLLLGAVRRRT